MDRPSAARRPWPLVVLSAWLAVPLAAAPPAASAKSDWPMDVVWLKNGTRLAGLIVEETPTVLHFQNVRRQPGRPTVVFATTFGRNEIDRLEKLDADHREQLKARLKELDTAGSTEQQRMEQIELRPVTWNGKRGGALRYTSDHFTLTAATSEAFARRAAVRLEQIYAAYARFLPPRHKGGAATSVILVPSMAEYQKVAKLPGKGFLNPAFYDLAANRIVCAGDLQKLSEDLEAARRANQKERDRLDRQEAQLRKDLPPQDLPRFLRPIQAARLRLQQADRQNDRTFDRETRRLFGTLYHEAFHAYLANFVYPPAKGDLPRWLNEGLAQVFETALVEAGELRIGHADRDRLARAQEALRKQNLLPLDDLLKADPKLFLVLHDGDRPGAARAYLTCWALAFYLCFEQHLLGSAALDRYVEALHKGTAPRQAFEALVGQPLPQFERDFHRYLGQLQPDGTTSKLVTGM